MTTKRRGPTPLEKLARKLRISAGLEPPIKRRPKRPKREVYCGNLNNIFELPAEKKEKKKPAQSKKIKSSKSKALKRDRPPDPDGYFKLMAGRAKKTIARYEKVNLGAERDELVWFLLIDLMHLLTSPRIFQPV